MIDLYSLIHMLRHNQNWKYLVEFIWYEPHAMRIYYLWIFINIRISSRAPKNIPLKPFQANSFSSHNHKNHGLNVSIFNFCNSNMYLEIQAWLNSSIIIWNIFSQTCSKFMSHKLVASIYRISFFFLRARSWSYLQLSV
jgi:hypothetical protein